METQKYIGVERRERTQGVRFDNTINLGHLLTFAGFLITIMVSWTTLDSRVTEAGVSAAITAIPKSLVPEYGMGLP